MITKAQKAWRKTEKGRAAMRAAQTRYLAKLTQEQKRQLHRRQNDKRRPDQLAARKEYHRWIAEHEPARKMFTHAKARAKQLGVPFDLRRQDIHIPKVCPALGIPLSKGVGKLHDGSPTLDRYLPEAGYVSGNVAVISHKANRIKNNATFLELEAVTAWIRNQK
jgi:hypothetical protein